MNESDLGEISQGSTGRDEPLWSWVTGVLGCWGGTDGTGEEEPRLTGIGCLTC